MNIFANQTLVPVAILPSRPRLLAERLWMRTDACRGLCQTSVRILTGGASRLLVGRIKSERNTEQISNPTDTPWSCGAIILTLRNPPSHQRDRIGARYDALPEVGYMDFLSASAIYSTPRVPSRCCFVVANHPQTGAAVYLLMRTGSETLFGFLDFSKKSTQSTHVETWVSTDDNGGLKQVIQRADHTYVVHVSLEMGLECGLKPRQAAVHSATEAGHHSVVEWTQFIPHRYRYGQGFP